MNACFHCGLAVPAGAAHRASVLGAEREFCCGGCQAVASTIALAGFDAYYRTRTAPAARPMEAAVPPLSRDATQASLILEHVRCAACLWLIESQLARQAGISRVEVNYATQRAHVAWDPSRTSLAAIVAAIRAVGYDAAPYQPWRQEKLEKRERRAALWRLFVAGFGAMQVMMYAFPAYVDEVSGEATTLLRWASLLLTLPVLLFSCAPFFSGARRELAQGRLGLDTPIALGLGLGFAASAWATVSGAGEVYFDSISMLAFLLLGARYLEAAARRRAARMLDPLLRCTDEQAALGQVLSIAPGMRVPADGVVLDGASSADESLLTGESRPVAKRAGDELVAGSINLEQPLTMRVTRAGADTRAAGIARLAERGAASRPRLVDAAERVARHLTWVIVLVAAGAAAYSGNPWIAVAVLVVACPCALALAAPIVLTRASGVLLRNGVLLARARALDALERATDIVFDKTGTLTTGRLVLRRTVLLGVFPERTCLDLAAALEATSRHPVARAFAPATTPVHAPRHFAGHGIEGEVEGRRLRIGTEAFCQELCRVPPAGPTHPNFDGSYVFLAAEGGWLAAFELADELRPHAMQVIQRLRERDITVHLATGDRPEVGAELAHALWIENCAGGMAPQDKYAYIERLQHEGRVVAMVGDGLNDAPVLARADVSIAMGGGADAAQLNADIVLLGERLDAITGAMETARRAMRRVRQNVAWAIGYNAAALPLAALGFIGPWEAALAMGASSITVLLNALRPLEDKPWKASTSSSPSPSPSYS